MTKLRECGDKDQLSKAEAIDRVHYKRRTLGSDLNAYKCKYCGFWHVGHRTKGRRKQW